MSSSPPTLPSLRPRSHASCLPWLAVLLPLVLCPLLLMPRPPIWQRLHLSTSHCTAASCCAPLSSGAGASRPPWLFVLSPLVMPPPPVRLCLHFSLHPHLSLCLSNVISLAGCRVTSPHHANASRPPATPTLVVLSPLVAPLSCLLSTLAGCCVAWTQRIIPKHIICLTFPPLTSRHGSHAMACESMEYSHHIHGCDVHMMMWGNIV